jgi:hypothetical protein
VILSKFISKSKIHSMIELYQVNNQDVQKEITAVIEKDTKLNGEITQLSALKCNCENNIGISLWNFPILCAFLYAIILTIESMPWPWPPVTIILTIGLIGIILGCDWAGD